MPCVLCLRAAQACTRCGGHPWSLGGSPTTFSTLRLGVERRRHFYAGDVETPSFLVKLFSGTRGQGDHDCVHGRDLIVGSNTLHECFNNVDVGAPLWQSKSRDKSSYREFASSHPSYLSFCISYRNLYAFTLLV